MPQLGFITPDWAPGKSAMDKKPVKREYIRNFFIVLVTKGSNETAVRRGYDTVRLDFPRVLRTRAGQKG
jgi:hypothetical protein